MNYNKIYFFNHFHNGDIHVSRTFVSEICKRIGKPYYTYSHRNNSSLLEDNDFIKHNSNLCDSLSHHKNIIERNSELFINTWYGCEGGKYISMTAGINFDCLYLIFENACNHLGFSLNDISPDPFYFFPSINYSQLNQHYIQNIDYFCKNKNYEDMILACNNQPLSGQASEFNFTRIFLELSKLYPNKIWILTNKDVDINKEKYPNIIHASDIIRKNNNFDLNEISYLSTKCKTIIGKASGPFSFSVCKDNWDNSDKKIITFSNLSSGKFWLGNWGIQNVRTRATIVESRETKDHNVIKVIAELI